MANYRTKMQVKESSLGKSKVRKGSYRIAYQQVAPLLLWSLRLMQLMNVLPIKPNDLENSLHVCILSLHVDKYSPTCLTMTHCRKYILNSSRYTVNHKQHVTPRAYNRGPLLKSHLAD